ncbi:MAG: zf-HC2 domain-containing protein [Dehalococcoidia bacterium]
MTSQQRRCLDPGAVTAEDLLAQARGEASEAVVEHLRRCAVCRDEARSYAVTGGLLNRMLYRRLCPATLTIGEYVSGLLPSAEMMRVAEHLVECPHCATESHGFRAFLAEPDPLPRDAGLLGALRRLLAQPLGPSRPALAGLRGQSNEEVVVYTADGLHITVNVQRSNRGSAVVGMLEQGGQSYTGATARLYAGDDLLETQNVDDLNYFLFADVPPGNYRIEVTVPSAVVVVDSLKVP